MSSALRLALHEADATPSAPAHDAATTGRPWTDVYAPRTLDEIEGNDAAKAALLAAIDGGAREPLVCYGPPGVGKRSAAPGAAARGIRVVEFALTTHTVADVARECRAPDDDVLDALCGGGGGHVARRHAVVCLDAAYLNRPERARSSPRCATAGRTRHRSACSSTTRPSSIAPTSSSCPCRARRCSPTSRGSPPRRGSTVSRCAPTPRAPAWSTATRACVHALQLHSVRAHARHARPPADEYESLWHAVDAMRVPPTECRDPAAALDACAALSAAVSPTSIPCSCTTTATRCCTAPPGSSACTTSCTPRRRPPPPATRRRPADARWSARRAARVGHGRRRRALATPLLRRRVLDGALDVSAEHAHALLSCHPTEPRVARRLRDHIRKNLS